MRVDFEKRGDELLVKPEFGRVIPIRWDSAIRPMLDDDAALVEGINAEVAMIEGGPEQDRATPVPTERLREYQVRFRKHMTTVRSRLFDGWLHANRADDPIFLRAHGTARALPFEVSAAPKTPSWLLACENTPIYRTHGVLSDRELWRERPPNMVVLIDKSVQNKDHRPYIERQLRTLQSVLRSAGGDLTEHWLEHPDDLQRHLEGRDPDVVQLIAHGSKDAQSTAIGGELLPNAEIATFILDSSPSVAILSSCYSSRPLPGVSLAEELIDGGTQLVIGARSELLQPVSAAFALGFMTAVCDGSDIGTAVRAGRMHVGRTQYSYLQTVITAHTATTSLGPHPAVADSNLAELDRVIQRHTAAASSAALPFARWEPTVPHSLCDLLHPVNAVMPLRGRSFDELTAWRDAEAPIAVTAIVGEGGWGKTRYGIEFMRRSARRGWNAHAVSVPAFTSESIPAILREGGDTLLLIDYAHRVPAEICSLIARWDEHHRDRIGHRLRLLLVLRVRPLGAGWLDRIEEHAHTLGPLTNRVIGAANTVRLSDTRMRTEDLRELAADTVKKFVRLWPTELDREVDPHEFHPTTDRPLWLGIEAIEFILSGTITDDPIRTLLQHERRCWPPPPERLDALASVAVAIATMTMGPSNNVGELAELLRASLQLRHPDQIDLAKWVHAAMGDELTLQPDRVGEAFVAQVLAAHRAMDAAFIERLLEHVGEHRPALIEFLQRATRHEALPARLSDLVAEPASHVPLPPAPRFEVEAQDVW